MSDAKALRAVQLLKQYCAERGCDDCVFQSSYGMCRLQCVKTPESYPVDGLKPREKPNQ